MSSIENLNQIVMQVKTVNKLNMYQAVQLVCDEHPDAWNTLPAFGQIYQLFASKVSTLKQQAYLHTQTTTGVREAKDAERAAVVKKAEVVANALRSLGGMISDTKLRAQLRFSHSNLMQCNAQRLMQYLDCIIEAATAHMAELPDYGVTQAKLDKLTLLRYQLEQTLLATRNAIVNRKSLSAELGLLTRELDQLLRVNLDPLILVLEPDYPEFFRLYQAARVVVDHKGKSGKPKPPQEPTPRE